MPLFSWHLFRQRNVCCFTGHSCPVDHNTSGRYGSVLACVGMDISERILSRYGRVVPCGLGGKRKDFPYRAHRLLRQSVGCDTFPPRSPIRSSKTGSFRGNSFGFCYRFRPKPHHSMEYLSFAARLLLLDHFMGSSERIPEAQAAFDIPDRKRSADHSGHGFSKRTHRNRCMWRRPGGRVKHYHCKSFCAPIEIGQLRDDLIRFGSPIFWAESCRYAVVRDDLP